MPVSSERPSSHTSHLLLLHLSVLLFGLSGVLGKGVSVSAVSITWGRVVFSSGLLLLTLLLRRESLRFQCRKDAGLFLLAGIVLAIHWTAFFYSIQISSVAIGTITFSSFPLFLVFLEPLVYREKFRKASLLSSLALLAGVLITIPEFSLANRTTVGLLWGMIGSFSYAVLTLFNRYFARSYSGARTSLYEQAVVVVVLLPVVLSLGERPTAPDITGIAALGILCTALASSLFVTGQKTVRAQTAGILCGMETVYGILFAFLFLQETPSLREILGAVVILTVVVITSLKTAEVPQEIKEVTL